MKIKQCTTFGHECTSEKTSVEKDLGVFIQDNLKFDRQTHGAVKRANKNALRKIKQTFNYLNVNSLSTL